MPSPPVGLFRRLLAGIFVLVLTGALYVLAQLPEASAADRASLAARYRFVELPIKLPPDLPMQTVRKVNPKYEHIRAWISSVGAAISLNDLNGQGVANDLCLVDTRSDKAIVTPAPESGETYEPFVLDPAPLPMAATISPMGCAPGDFNGDGWTDLLVYYWGRTPVIFMNTAMPGPLMLHCFKPIELIPNQTIADNGLYHGKLWNTNAVNIADYDGDGHPDIGIFNYFPDTEVLNPQGQPGVQMNHSMSRAQNAGGAHVMRWKAATKDAVIYEEQPAIDPAFATGWTLGAGSADLDGDLLPELYLANDFGQDRFFHNVSTRGHIKFKLAEGRRGPLDPKSLVLGHDSFKGMSIDFADLRGTGRYDAFVSNITTSWGLEESNLVWRNTANTPQEAHDLLSQGIAPYEFSASEMNMAWVGWGWDAKMADFDNSGKLVVVQACGFVKGTINRFNWLQELAMSNDLMLQEPDMWPKAEPGDDISGKEPMAFWVPEGHSGRYVNLSKELGLAVPIPTRGVAVADTNGDGWQDFAIARQWGPPAFYRNENAGQGKFLGLRLYRPASGSPFGTPAYGAQVKIVNADGRVQLAQLDGGGGHSGKRSFDVFFGLGNSDRPVAAELSWRDLNGVAHKQTLKLGPGWHNVMLTDKAMEVHAQ